MSQTCSYWDPLQFANNWEDLKVKRCFSLPIENYHHPTEMKNIISNQRRCLKFPYFNYLSMYILQHLFLWKYWITGVVSAIVIALGCIGNLTAILLLQKPKMSTAFNQLLIVLCIFDTIFLISNIPTTELALQSRKLLSFW